MNGLTYRQLHPEKFKSSYRPRWGRIGFCGAVLAGYLFFFPTFNKNNVDASIRQQPFLKVNRPDLDRIISQTKVPYDLKLRIKDLESISEGRFDREAALSMCGAEEWYVHTSKKSKKGAVGRWQLTKPAVQDVVEIYFDYGSRKESLPPLLLSVYNTIDHYAGRYINKMTNKTHFAKNKKELIKLFFKNVGKYKKLNDEFGISNFAITDMRARILCSKYDVEFSNDVTYAINNTGYTNVESAMSKLGRNWRNYSVFDEETRLHMYKARQFNRQLAGKRQP